MGSLFASAVRGEVVTKDLLSLKDGIEKRLTPQGAAGQVSAVPSQDPASPGLVFTTKPGKAGTPGINLAPPGAKAWDLSAFGHVEARVVNTGSKAARFVLRVDNEGDWRKSPWSTSQLDLPPGERGTLKVIFGYQFNQPGFPLDPKRIVNILIYTDTIATPTSFRIESLAAAGPAGEKPYVEPPPIWIKRQTGATLASSGVQVDTKKWKLVWADEFDYTGLPDSAKWSYEEGYIRNKEPQYYTRARKENAWVEGGVLTITARQEDSFLPPQGHGADGKTKAKYTSASLNTRDKAS